MRRSALGRKALTVLVSTAMVVSMMPTAALADAVGAGETPTEQSQVKENGPGGGDSEKVTDADSIDNGTSEGAANGQTTTEQGPTTQTGDNSQQGPEPQKPAAAEIAEVNGKSYTSLQAAIDAAARKATVKLLTDTTENVTISTPYVTLDLNGHTLNGSTGERKPALTVTARVTVKDSSEAQTGTIKREDTAENSGVSSHYVIDVQGAGWLTFESGNVTNGSGNAAGKGASLVRVGDDSVAKYPGLNIKGGTFTQNNFIVIKVDRGDLFLNGGTLNSDNSYAIEDWHRATIKGGTVNGAVAAWTYSGGHNSDLTIAGGTVNGKVESVTYDGAEGKTAKVSITGGVVNGNLSTSKYNSTEINDPTKATIEVTGGTFSTDPSRYLIEGSAATPNADGTFGVAKAYLAKVGETSYYTMDEAFKAQTASGEAITLLRDYTTGGTFNSGSDTRVVDLNGHTWTCTGTDANSAAFEINYADASLTVKNGKVVSSQLIGLIPSAMGGTIKYDNSTLTFENVEASTTATSGIETNGNNTNDTVVLKNSTLNVPNGFGIYFPSSGTLTIDNSTINAKTMGAQVCSGSLNVNAGSTITVSGDPVTKTENDGAIQDGAAISVVNRPGYKGLGKVAITGGAFTAKTGNAALKAYTWDSSTKQESAFDNSVKTVTVYGGTFSSAVPEALCAEGCTPVENPDGTHGVSGSVAQVGFKAFNTLQAAIDAAQDGETVTLLADATEDVTVAAGKNITLDLGGKTLTNTNAGKATLTIAKGATATVKNGNVVGGTGFYTIQNNGTATLEDVIATAGNNGSSMIDNYGTLAITSGTYTGGLDTVKNEPNAKLTITGGAFTLTKGNSDGFTGVVFNYGELIISGGEFIQSDKNAPYGQAQVIHTDKSGSTVPSTVISGGTFKNLCTRTTAWTVRATNAAAGSTQVKGGVFNKKPSESYWAEGYVLVKNADGMYGAKEGSYVAKIGSDKYDSVQAAIDSVKSSGTITLLVDVNEDLVVNKGKKVVLDLNGFTLTNVNDHTITNNGTLTIKDSSAAKTGTVDNLTHGKAPVKNNQGATCTIAGGNFTRSKEAGESSTNSGGNSYYYIENFGTMTIGGDVKVSSNGHFSSLVHNGWYDGSKNTAKTNAVMTINSGSFAGGINTVKNDDYGEITLNGGTFQNATQHPLFNVNIATVNGGSFESTTDSAVYTKAYDDAGDKGTTTIKGGTFKSAADKGDLKVDNSTHLSTVSVSGGSFSCEVPEAYRAEGFSSVKNSDGTYGVAKKGASAESTDGKTSGSVATNNEVVVEQEEQKKFAETAAGAAEAVKNVTVEPGATEAKIGDVTVDTSKDGKATEVSNVAREAAKNDASVNVQLVVKANKAAETNEEIVKAAPKAKPIPFELSVDMVTEVRNASGAVTATSTVPVKELASEITVSITVNPASIKGKNVTVARVHGDAVDIIAPDSVDYDNGIVTFRTSKFSDYAVLANAKTANLSSYKVVNGTRTAPNPADFGVVNPEEYAFAGWYKDAEFTKPYTVTAKNGTAYPKFVKISDLIIFKGGSLRTDLTGEDNYSKTSLRFGYEMHAPDGAKLDRDNWGWTYRNPISGASASVKAENYWRIDNNGVITNLVIREISKDGQTVNYSTRYEVNAQLAYVTKDGTKVCVKDETRVRSVNDVAEAIKNDSFASDVDLKYANGILGK